MVRSKNNDNTSVRQAGMVMINLVLILSVGAAMVAAIAPAIA